MFIEIQYKYKKGQFITNSLININSINSIHNNDKDGTILYLSDGSRVLCDNSYADIKEQIINAYNIIK